MTKRLLRLLAVFLHEPVDRSHGRYHGTGNAAPPLLEGRQGRNAWIPFDFPVPRAQTALMMVDQVFFFDVVITEHEVVQPPFPQQMIRLDDPQIVLDLVDLHDELEDVRSRLE